MYGKKVRLRIVFIISVLTTIILSIYIILKLLEDDVVYFKSPTEIKNTQDLKIDYDEKAIYNSIRNIFNTKKGQKILNPTFGLDLEQYPNLKQ